MMNLFQSDCEIIDLHYLCVCVCVCVCVIVDYHPKIHLHDDRHTLFQLLADSKNIKKCVRNVNTRGPEAGARLHFCCQAQTRY